MPFTPHPDHSRHEPGSTAQRHGLSTPTDAHVPDKVIRAGDLLGKRQAVQIEHNGQHYRLQTTRAGKLILTK